jgi:mono/diheme cytochrome c family protein
MFPTIGKVILVLVVILLLVVGGAFAAMEIRLRRTFDASYPSIAATTDPAVIERGRYLVYGPAACAYCHVPRDQWTKLQQGVELALTGNHLFPLPFGAIYSANITPDQETGIGRRTDGDLARILRYGVRADGKAAIPLMEFQGLSDEDLTAVVSFLKSRPGVRHPVPDHRLNMLGKAVMAFAIKPEGPSEPPPRTSPAGVSIERGSYLANKVSSCAGCHTERSTRDGSLVGPRFAGGGRLDVAADPTKVYVTPNLTPDPKTGVIGAWTEEMFIVRFRQGEAIPGSPMPWGAYAQMTDDDLRSLFSYLRSLPPVERETGPRVQAKN